MEARWWSIERERKDRRTERNKKVQFFLRLDPKETSENPQKKDSDDCNKHFKDSLEVRCDK